MAPIIGTDEVGVGSLAGPLVAAAVAWPPGAPHLKVADSKTMTAKRREEALQTVYEACLCVTVGFVSPARVDQYGVHRCRLALMKLLAQRIRRAAKEPFTIIVDGDRELDLVNCHAIVKADKTVPAVSAASIVAKVWRDRFMVGISEDYPEYGFGKHKGYPTAEHKRALQKFGPCDQHRQSYRTVRDAQLAVC